jgi:RNA polymerase sigma-70 factor, ECF subfamily
MNATSLQNKTPFQNRQANPAVIEVGTPAPDESVPTPAKIFSEYAPRIYNLCRRMLGNEADAEDVTQQVFMQVIRKLPTFRHEAAFSTWLYRIAVNAALAYRQKRARREEHFVRDPMEVFLESGGHRGPVRRWVSDPEKVLLDHEVHRLIEEAISRLPATYRDVFVLADVEEQPNLQISKLLGLSVPAVQSRLHRARLLMRHALTPCFEERAA